MTYCVICDMIVFFSSIECKQTRSLTLTWLVSLNSRFMSSRLSLETVATVHRQNSSTITWFSFFNSSPGFPRKQRLHADDGENSLSKRNYNRSRSFRMILLLYMRCRKLCVTCMKHIKVILFCLSALHLSTGVCISSNNFRKYKKKEECIFQVRYKCGFRYVWHILVINLITPIIHFKSRYHVK